MRKKLDKRLTFTWTGPFENWARAWVKKNHWRTRTLLGGEDDALQQCGMLYAICINRYAETVTNPAWMMSLYKMVVINEWNTYADKDRKLRMARDPERLAAQFEMTPQTEASYGPLLARFHNASAELLTVLKVLADAPAEFLEMVFADNLVIGDGVQAEKLAARRHENTNRRMRKMCRVPGDVDLLTELRQLLT